MDRQVEGRSRISADKIRKFIQEEHKEGRLSSVVLYRARWLVPVSSPPVEDGAVLVQGGAIQAAGRYANVKKNLPEGTVVVDCGQSALIPGLVNTHTHLDLSILRREIPLPQPSFDAWLDELVPRLTALKPETQIPAYLKALKHLSDSGTSLYGDITNGNCLMVIPSMHTHVNYPRRQAFLEVLGFDRRDIETALAPDIFSEFIRAFHDGFSLALAAHSSYSTSGDLIRKAKEWSRIRRQPFSIHVAEHHHEMEFLQTGTGYIRELLEEMKRWVPHWSPPRATPVEYLHRLGILDPLTIVVHAVHMTDIDWNTVAKSGCHVCFCPRSNQNLNVGRANIEKAFRMGISISLGTDSLASNTDLNLFAEGAFVLNHYPSLPPEAVLEMMTMGGARALRWNDRFGSIEPGKKASLLCVDVAELTPQSRLHETIIREGERGACLWASHRETV